MNRARHAGFPVLGYLLVFASASAGGLTGYDELVILRSADETVSEAAADLAGIIERTTGRRPEIRWQRLVELRKSILIGADPRNPAFDDDPLTDEILIARTANGLEIRGSDNTATGFAVYRFIENFLGWRYYQPGELGLERLDDPPPIPEIEGEPGILLMERPGFHSRNLSGTTNRDQHIDWSKWHCMRERFAYNHQLHRVVTPERFETHPQWFAKQQGGEPKKPPYPVIHGHNDHPDLGNREVRQAAVAAFRADFAVTLNPPKLAAYSLSLADSFEFGWYPEDYRWRPRQYFRRWPDWSNLVFDYANAVAGGMEEYWNSLYPDADNRPPLYLGALSYLTWEGPPEFAVHPSIVPYLTYDRSQWYDPLCRRDDLENVGAWAGKETRVLGTWDYLFGYGFLMPRSLTTIVSDSIPLLHGRGVRAYFSQVEPVWPFDQHTTWLASRLLWNPMANASELLDEFFREFYGPAESGMRDFFNLAGQTWMQQSEALSTTGTGVASGEATGWWLRYWKDPWQAALWNTGVLERMDLLLATALEITTGQEHQRFHQRIRQTADLFAVTRTFVDYQHSLWAWSTGKFEMVKGNPVEQRKAFAGMLASAIAAHPQAANAGDLSWVNRYDSSGSLLFEMARASEASGQQLIGWCRLQGFTGTPRVDEPPQEIPLPPFGSLESPGNWRRALLDSEYASIESVLGSDSLLARNVRRGHVYQGFRVDANQFYLAQADVETAQSPSGEIYIRIDFFDADNKLIGSSNRARIAPTSLYGDQQQLRVLAQAPATATAGRLVMRFFEMDRASEAVVTNPRLFRMAGHPFR